MTVLVPFLGRSPYRIARLEGGVRRMWEHGWVKGEVIATADPGRFLRIRHEGTVDLALVGAGALEDPRTRIDRVVALVRALAPLPLLLMADEKAFRAREWWQLRGTGYGI